MYLDVCLTVIRGRGLLFFFFFSTIYPLTAGLVWLLFRKFVITEISWSCPKWRWKRIVQNHRTRQCDSQTPSPPQPSSRLQPRKQKQPRVISGLGKGGRVLTYPPSTDKQTDLERALSQSPPPVWHDRCELRNYPSTPPTTPPAPAVICRECGIWLGSEWDWLAGKRRRGRGGGRVMVCEYSAGVVE
jgi:hypothetical protein